MSTPLTPTAAKVLQWSAAFSTQALQGLLLPLIGIGLFLVLWGVTAAHIETSLGQLPGPLEVWQQTRALYQEHQAERAKQAAFQQRQAERNQRALERDPQAQVKWRDYTGRPTFLDQIITSLVTVATGFLLASLIAIPLGILCGMSATLYAAVNPFIQVFKPVSPLAWLPLVTMVVSARPA